MQSGIVRGFFKLRRFRRFYNSTHRCSIALSAAKTTINAVQSVYMNKYECLVLKWNNGSVDEYPYVYLRENCRCSTCYRDERKSRSLYSPKEVDLDIKAVSACWNSEWNELKVSWEDGHTSHYSPEWLIHLRYVNDKLQNLQYYSTAWG